MRSALAFLRSMVFGAAALLALPASAQILENLAEPNLLETWRVNTGNVIRFCYYDNSETVAVDRAVGEAIAERLLLESRFSTLRSGHGIGGNFAADDLYISLVNDCDVALGMGLAADAYPPEFTVTRPYVGYNYLLIAADPAFARLEDVPRDRWLGTQLGSYGDYLLRQYLAVRPASDTWRRLVYGDVHLMLDRLLDGTLGAAIIFGPTLLRVYEERTDADGFHQLPLIPELAANVDIGGVLLSRSTFLRSEVDKAIADIVADGTVDAILADTGFDAIPSVAGGH